MRKRCQNWIQSGCPLSTDMLIHLCGISPSRQQAMRGNFFPRSDLLMSSTTGLLACFFAKSHLSFLIPFCLTMCIHNCNIFHIFLLLHPSLPDYFKKTSFLLTVDLEYLSLDFDAHTFNIWVH